MEDDVLVKFRQISEIFNEKFQSSVIQQHNQTYINGLYKQLDYWRLRTNEQIKEIIEEKIEEIKQIYEQYCQEIDEKYTKINEQIENNNSLSDINDQIKNFNIYFQSNKIENCIHLNTIQFTNDQLTEKIQLEYVLHPDLPSEITTVPFTKNQFNEKTELEYVPFRDSSPETTPVPFTKNQFNEKTEVEYVPLRDSPQESTVVPFTKTRLTDKIQLDHVPYHDLPIETTTGPLKTIIKERSESIHSTHTSSRTSPIPAPVQRRLIQDNSEQVVHKDGLILKTLTSPLKEKPFISHKKPTTTTTNNKLSKTLTRLYIGEHDILTPVLIDKNREVYNETERITEYSIDSILIPKDNQEQSSNINTDNDDNTTLVRAYKVLIKDENNYQQLSISSSDREEEEEINIDNVFNLQQFNQINYSTILFKECETAYNCISSSTKRNELIVYNSKLKVLIILQHENYEECPHRFYLQWPEHLCPNISDITYCQNNDQFLISTWDTSHIYFFNRDLLSLINLGRLSNELPLRRIHCYHETIYCILSNNYLLEFQLNEEYSNIKFIQKIILFNPINHSQDTVYHLLDITCDDNYLIIIYSNEYDEIHLQSIHRQTKQLHCDFILDNKQPINQNYIRIESTNYYGNFIYLNGTRQYLKTIDLVNYDNGKITSVMYRHTKPTNICFLKDGRLVILYEVPYFLSVHDVNIRQEVN